jgi:hypothetical protein
MLSRMALGLLWFIWAFPPTYRVGMAVLAVLR